MAGMSLEGKLIVKHVEGTDNMPLFQPVDFHLAPGDRIVVRGPSGVGKTTLLRVIAGLIPYEEGTITLDGKSMCDWGYPNWRARVLYVPQRPAALPGTPWAFWEGSGSYAAQKKRLSEKTEALVDPRDIADDLGIGEELWVRNWSTLSGGEAQRVLLAIALALDPDVLLLDEPTSALDGHSCDLVEDLLRKKTFLCVSHDENQADRLHATVLTLYRPTSHSPSGEEDTSTTP